MKTYYKNLWFWQRWFKPVCPSCKTRMIGPTDEFDTKYECKNCGDVLFDIDYNHKK